MQTHPNNKIPNILKQPYTENIFTMVSGHSQRMRCPEGKCPRLVTGAIKESNCINRS